MREFAVVKAVYEALRVRARERGAQGVIASWVRDVIGAVFDLSAVNVEVDVDPYEVATRLEAVKAVVEEIERYVAESRRDWAGGGR